jgi:hypothetical protein
MKYYHKYQRNIDLMRILVVFFFTTKKTPYLLTLALTKLLLEFIIQPIRSGGQSELLSRPKCVKFISHSRSIYFIFDDIFWMCYAAFCALAFTFKIDGERVGAISVNFFSRKMN